MKYRVKVETIEDDGHTTSAVYDQLVDAESFDLAALIRQVNTRKRGPRASRKKEG